MDGATAQELVSQIDTPDHPELQQLQQNAIDQVKTVLESNGITPSPALCKRLSYTYYYDWVTDDPDHLLLVQDPGNLHDRHLGELRPNNPLVGNCSLREQIGMYRAFGLSWLTGRNADFSQRFLEALADQGLISLPDGWQEYIESGHVYRDFYLGDVVKYRVDGFSTTAERISYEAFLESELEAVAPEVVFTFGGYAWSAIRRYTDPQPVTDTDVDQGSIMASHGVPHHITTPAETFIIPLAHMSGQVWWRFPPDDYITRLKEALETWERY